MKKPIYYSQKDKHWGSIPYTIDGDKSETIGASGCGPTCAAMILAEWIDPKITPKESCQMAIDMKDRTANDGTEWDFFKHIADKYKLRFKQTSLTDEVVKALQEGNALVVCSMKEGYFTKGGHFILAYDYQNGNIIVNDPASTTRTSATVQLFKAQSKQYFIFYQPADKPKSMTAVELVTFLHNTTPVVVNDLTQGVQKAASDKYVFNLMTNMVNHIKAKG